MKMFSPLDQRAHPTLAVVGTTLVLSMTAIIVAEGLCSPPRASAAVRGVVIACMLLGSVCSLFGCVPKQSSREARQ